MSRPTCQRPVGGPAGAPALLLQARGAWLQGCSVISHATSASPPQSVSCSFLLRVPPRDDQPPPAWAHLTHTDRLPGESPLLILGNCVLCAPCPWRVPPAGPVTCCHVAPPWRRPPAPSPLLPLPALATHAAASTPPSCTGSPLRASTPHAPSSPAGLSLTRPGLSPLSSLQSTALTLFQAPFQKTSKSPQVLNFRATHSTWEMGASDSSP